MQGFFHHYLHNSAKGLIVQPRMGFSEPGLMRRGLEAMRALPFPRVGTLTLDSFTRTGREREASKALALGQSLNGYPLTCHTSATNRALLEGLLGPDFPVQVRHGCAQPQAIFRALIDAGIDASEGGPISYCLPYSRIPLEASFASWAESVSMFAQLRERGIEPHLESFGGCMLGQLCPPVLLLTLCLLEAMFFREHGMRSLSLSYAQGSNFEQDLGAVLALHQLAHHYLGDIDWHVVIYTFMGLFPKTLYGARRAVEESAQLALLGGARRLIVKTAAEADRIPTLDDNLAALTWAAGFKPNSSELSAEVLCERDELFEQVTSLIEHILAGSAHLSQAMLRAFREGWLDIPYCLHPENRGLTRSWLDRDGRIIWLNPGNIPLPHLVIHPFAQKKTDSGAFLTLLSYNQRKFDQI